MIYIWIRLIFVPTKQSVMKGKQNILKEEFVAIYTFKVKKGKEKQIIEGWKGVTKLIYQYEGSLGSRLHKVNNNMYVAYAIWPSKNKWEHAGDLLPDSVNKYKDMMKSSCHESKTLFELNMVEDLIMNNQFKK